MSKLKSIVSFVDLKGAVAHVDLRGQVTHVNLQFADLYLNPDTVDRLLADSFSYTDVLIYSVAKGLEDVAFVNEDLAIEFSRPLPR